MNSSRRNTAFWVIAAEEDRRRTRRSPDGWGTVLLGWVIIAVIAYLVMHR